VQASLFLQLLFPFQNVKATFQWGVPAIRWRFCKSFEVKKPAEEHQ